MGTDISRAPCPVCAPSIRRPQLQREPGAEPDTSLLKPVSRSYSAPALVPSTTANGMSPSPVRWGRCCPSVASTTRVLTWS